MRAGPAVALLLVPAAAQADASQATGSARADALQATGSADALQARVLAAARATSPDRFAFRRTLTMTRTGSAPKVIVEAFDPTRSEPSRWQLVSVDGRAPADKDLAAWRKQKRGDTPSYREVARWFGGPATATPAGPGRVLYRFARLPAGTFKVNGRDLSADTAAEALVNAGGRVPYVERTRLSSTKAIRLMLVARLDTMTATGRYRQLGDGQVVPDSVTSDLTGSLMGKSGSMTVRIAYSDQRAVR